jgi:diadenosine tetraphosphate (Ap4A) HIT family hydrolase
VVSEEATPTLSEAILRAIRSAEGPDGRLPMPDFTNEDIFPFEGEIVVRHVADLVVPEPPRNGEPGGGACHACSTSDDDMLLVSEHWRLGDPGPLGVPAAVLLYPREHADLDDLRPERVAELGPLLVRVEAAVRSVSGIGRVHIYRFGDGGAHLHWWFFGRPQGLVQLRGSCLTLWDDVLPRRPADEWGSTLQGIVRALEAAGGLTVAE